jgi:hypothetical protein
MPPKNRVGRDDRGHLTKAVTAQPVPVPRQRPAFCLGQADPAAYVSTQDAVLFDQVSSSADLAEVSQALLVQGADEAWPQGTKRRSRCRRRRHQTTESDLGMSPDRATDHTGLRYSHQQGRGAAHSRGSVPPETRLGGAVLADGSGSREGQSVESGSVSVRIGHTTHTLGARGDGPMYAAHRGLWRAPRRRG